MSPIVDPPSIYRPSEREACQWNSVLRPFPEISVVTFFTATSITTVLQVVLISPHYSCINQAKFAW